MLPDEPLLSFWKRNEKKLPKLAYVARKVLSQPPSASESERHWSDLRLTVPYYRSRLSGETMTALLKFNNSL